MSEQFHFSIPSLPKEIYHKFQELRKAHGLTQKQCLILGVFAICHIGEQPNALEPTAEGLVYPKIDTIKVLIARVREKYPSKKEGI